jgi:hypothetical protein
MARVQVNDEVWGAYRAGLGATPVSVALGELLRREVGRRARRRAIDVAGVRLALDEHAARSEDLAADHRPTPYGTFAGPTPGFADPSAF